jgi:hypothetical protein
VRRAVGTLPCAFWPVAYGLLLVADGPDGIDSIYTEYLTQVLKRLALKAGENLVGQNARCIVV